MASACAARRSEVRSHAVRTYPPVSPTSLTMMRRHWTRRGLLYVDDGGRVALVEGPPPCGPCRWLSVSGVVAGLGAVQGATRTADRPTTTRAGQVMDCTPCAASWTLSDSILMSRRGSRW